VSVHRFSDGLYLLRPQEWGTECADLDYDGWKVQLGLRSGDRQLIHARGRSELQRITLTVDMELGLIRSVVADADQDQASGSATGPQGASTHRCSSGLARSVVLVTPKPATSARRGNPRWREPRRSQDWRRRSRSARMTAWRGAGCVRHRLRRGRSSSATSPSCSPGRRGRQRRGCPRMPGRASRRHASLQVAARTSVARGGAPICCRAEECEYRVRCDTTHFI
jgi:hypothetical protein